MANYVDPDQTAPLEFDLDLLVFSGLSVSIFGVNIGNQAFLYPRLAKYVEGYIVFVFLSVRPYKC